MDTVFTLTGLKCPHCGSEHLRVTGIKGALGASLVTGAAFGAVGNLIAGSSAAADEETKPLQYQCLDCKKLFQSLPLAAQEEEILDQPCMVTFTRERSFVGGAVPQIVYLNGCRVGAVKNGASVTFPTSCRNNVIFVTDQYGVAFQDECRFEAQPGSGYSVRFNRRFVSASPAPLTAGEDAAGSGAVRQDVKQNIRGFHRFTAIFNLVAALLLLIPIVGNAASGTPEPDFILTFTVIMVVLLGFSIWSVAAQHSSRKPYPTWMKVINTVLFVFIAVFVVGELITVIAISM